MPSNNGGRDPNYCSNLKALKSFLRHFIYNIHYSTIVPFIHYTDFGYCLVHKSEISSFSRQECEQGLVKNTLMLIMHFKIRF